MTVRTDEPETAADPTLDTADDGVPRPSAAGGRLDDGERRRLDERYAEIARLAGGLAHEVRNPLSTIGMNLELLVEEIGAGESSRDHRMLQKVRSVQQECERLEDVLDSFLQFVTLGEMDLAPTSLNDVVVQFVDFFRPQAEERAIDVSPHLAADLPLVELDDRLFRQVLVNLARNAQQAMPEGGPLELQTRVVDEAVVLEVIDGGIGMNEATRSRIFDTFFSTRNGGSGLGLPTVARIVEAHGGSIACDSEPGRGTRFTITLPAING